MRGPFPTPLAGAPWLLEHLKDPDLAIFDVRWYLGKPLGGIEAYRRAHIPGAIFADTDRDLSGPLSRKSGRHPWPNPLSAARSMERLGISNQTFVVCCDDAGGSVAARMWFVLKWLGHSRVAVLDGGLSEWKRRGYPLSADFVRPRSRGEFRPNPSESLLLSKSEAARVSRGERPGVLADARAAERYRGEVEPVDARPGHIPGAVSLPFSGNLENGRFAAPRDLQERLGASARSPGGLVSYCGSGVTACHNLLALEAAGLPAGRLYTGSWSEWAKDEGLTAEKGG